MLTRPVLRRWDSKGLTGTQKRGNPYKKGLSGTRRERRVRFPLALPRDRKFDRKVATTITSECDIIRTDRSARRRDHQENRTKEPVDYADRCLLELRLRWSCSSHS